MTEEQQPQQMTTATGEVIIEMTELGDMAYKEFSDVITGSIGGPPLPGLDPVVKRAWNATADKIKRVVQQELEKDIAEGAVSEPSTSLSTFYEARVIHGHEVNEANRRIIITADEKNVFNGNASHHYKILVGGSGVQFLHFQDGPIKEGMNGVTIEALLAIVVDRLESFQTSEFSCRENALALTKLQEAQHWLNARTQARVQRGVEGTHVP